VDLLSSCLVESGQIQKSICSSISDLQPTQSIKSLLLLCSIRDITKEVAAAVIKEAVAEDLAEGYRGMDARALQRLDKVGI